MSSPAKKPVAKAAASTAAPAKKPAASASATVAAKKPAAAATATKTTAAKPAAAAAKPAAVKASTSSPAAAVKKSSATSSPVIRPQSGAKSVEPISARSRPTTASKDKKEDKSPSRPTTASKTAKPVAEVKAEPAAVPVAVKKPVAVVEESKEEKKADSSRIKAVAISHHKAHVVTKDPISVDALIIGAGFSGCSAAMNLHEKYNVENFVVLEAFDRVGGRNFSYQAQVDDKLTDYNFEHGAQYIGNDQSKMLALMDKLKQMDDKVDGYKCRLQYRQQVMVLNNKIYSYDRDDCSFQIGGVPPGLTFFDLLSVMLMVQEIGAIEGSINVLEPWSDPTKLTPPRADFRSLEFVTMAQFLNLDPIPPEMGMARDWVTDIAAALIQVSVQAVLSCEANELSVLYFLWYCCTDSGFLNAVNDENNGPQQYYHAKGFNYLLEQWIKPIADKFHWNEAATSIDTTNAGAVAVTTSNGQKYIAKQVICTMTPKAVGQCLTFNPPLAADRAAVTDKSNVMGRTIKCQVFYKTQWWNSSMGLSYTGYSGAVSYPVCWVMDYSPASRDPSQAGKPGAACLMTFTIGHQADILYSSPGGVTKAKLQKLVTDCLCMIFHDTRALCDGPEFLDIIYHEWTPVNNGGSPFIPGGPNTLFPPAANFLFTMDGSTPIAENMLNFVPVNDSLVFATSEFTKNLDAKLPSGWPTIDPQTQLVTVYSDARQALGYMDGAISSGETAASIVGPKLQPKKPAHDGDAKAAEPMVCAAAPTVYNTTSRRAASANPTDAVKNFAQGISERLTKFGDKMKEFKKRTEAAAAAAAVIMNAPDTAAAPTSAPVVPVDPNDKVFTDPAPQTYTKAQLFTFLTAFLQSAQADQVKCNPTAGQSSSNWVASMTDINITEWILINVGQAMAVAGMKWDGVDVAPLEELIRVGKRYTFPKITTGLQPNGEPIYATNPDYDLGCDRLSQTLNFTINARIAEAKAVQGPQNTGDDEKKAE